MARNGDNLLDRALTQYAVDCIPEVVSALKAALINAHSVTGGMRVLRYASFEEIHKANSLSSGAACVTKTVVREWTSGIFSR